MPPVLCHTDVWTYNYLFDNDQLMAIIDWGDCYRGSCMFDIAVLVFEVDVADHANTVVEEYFQVSGIYVKIRYPGKLIFHKNID
jgi:Ser/Thr protein kinase RdoA (MazF antagonist)